MDESGHPGSTTAAVSGDEPTVALAAGGNPRPAVATTVRSASSASKSGGSAALEATTALPAGAATASATRPADDSQEVAEVPATGQNVWGEGWAEWVWEQAGCTILSAGLHIVVFIVLALTLGTIKISEKK